MNRLALLAIGAVAASGIAAGCSSSGSSTSTSTSSAPSSAPAQTTGGAAVVKTATSPLGQILVDGSGRTLYLYKPDTGTTSTCTGACASTWPPDTTSGTPQANGVTASALGTTVRSDDHATQVTFHGHPLYYFSGDAKAGQTSGQGTQGIWFAVSPSGIAITSTNQAPSTNPAPGTSGGSGGYGY